MANSVKTSVKKYRRGDRKEARHRVTDRISAGDEAVARLAAIIESSDDAIVGKTLGGVITSWNQAAERIFGYTAAEAVGQQITLIIPEERRSEEAEVLARLVRGERIEHFETIRRTKDGRSVEISLTVSPIRDSSGRIIGASKTARDISDRRRLEHERQMQTLKRELGRLVVDTTAKVTGKVLTPEDQRRLQEEAARQVA